LAAEEIDGLSEAINTARTRVWRKNKRSFFERAIIDVDGTIAGTHGECKEGMDMSYKGIWGYAPLLVTLANTGEILYTRNRPGNRPSHDGCFEYLDPAVEVVRDAGFRKVRLRGDGHFSLTDDFDYWTEKRVEFVFGLPGHPKLVGIAEGLEEGSWRQLRRDGRRRTERTRGLPKPRVKRAIIEERGYKHLELEREDYTEFDYQPAKCSRSYRVVVLRKTTSVKRGEALLIPEIRYHFYITNVPKSGLTARQVVREANERCNQENLIEQTKNGVHAMRMPCDTLLANDAYMLIACLAWNLKSWIAQLWPDREQGKDLLRMEFRRFIASIIAIPCQVVRTGRHIVHRFLAYSRWLKGILRAHAHFKRLVFA
jgi:Transposase DDE domain group 1